MLGFKDGDLGSEVAQVVLERIFTSDVRGVGELRNNDGARMPRITTTIRISIRVKARSRRGLPVHRRGKML